MSPVQVLVVLSTMVVINQAATLKYENQSSVAAGYDAGKMANKILNNKTYFLYENYTTTTTSYYFNATDFRNDFNFSEINATDIFESINNPNVTALPVLKSNWISSILKEVVKGTVEGARKIFLGGVGIM